MKKRILIIGVGYMGKKHLHAYIKNINATIVGLVVRSDESAKKASSEYNLKVFTDVDEAIKKTQPDLVSICTPTKSHAEIGRKCLEQGLNVLIEKPLGETSEEAEFLKLFSEKTGRKMICAHTELFTPAMQSFFDFLKMKKNIVSISFEKSGRDISEKYLVHTSIPTKRDLFDSLIHSIYVLNAILPGIPSEVSTQKLFQNQGIISSFKINGVTARVSFDLNSESSLRNKISVVFSDGELVYSLEDGEEKISFDGQDINIGYFGKDRFDNLIDFFIKDDLSADYRGSSKNALETIHICEKIIESIDTDNIRNEKKIAYLQVTRNCNNDCVFCSNPKFEKDHSIEYIKKLIEEYKKDGITELFITGGEPTIHPGIFDIIASVKNAGIIPRMITNGIKLSDESFFKKITASGLDSIHISFHTHLNNLSEQMHGRIDCVDKQKMALSINERMNSQVKIHLNTTINSLNYKYLPGFVSFIMTNYPKIKHIVFNFLDPGTPDGRLKSNAAKNSWVVAKYFSAERYINSALRLLRENSVSFRIERVPLCYLAGFEAYSTETRKIVKNEKYRIFFLRAQDESEKREVFPSELRIKIDVCNICTLTDICAGIQKEYADLYGTGEIYPVFEDEKQVYSRILY